MSGQTVDCLRPQLPTANDILKLSHRKFKKQTSHNFFLTGITTGNVVHAHNASTWEVQTGFGSSTAQQVWGQ